MEISKILENFHGLYAIIQDGKNGIEVPAMIYYDKKYKPDKLFFLQNSFPGGEPINSDWRKLNYNNSWEFNDYEFLKKLKGEVSQTSKYVLKITTDKEFKNEIDVEETWNQKTVILKQFEWYHKLERGVYLTHIGNEYCPKGLIMPALFNFINDNLFENFTIPSEYIKKNFRFSTIKEVKLLKSHMSDNEYYVLTEEEIDNLEDHNELEFIVNENVKKPKFPLIDDSCVIDFNNLKEVEINSGMLLFDNLNITSVNKIYLINKKEKIMLNLKTFNKYSNDEQYFQHVLILNDAIYKLLISNDLNKDTFIKHFDFNRTDYNYKYNINDVVNIKYPETINLSNLFPSFNCEHGLRGMKELFINSFIIVDRVAGMYVLQNIYIKDYKIQVFECFLSLEEKELKKVNYTDSRFGKIYSHSLLPPYSFLIFRGKKIPYLINFFPVYNCKKFINTLKLKTLIEIPNFKFNEYINYAEFIKSDSYRWILKTNKIKKYPQSFSDLKININNKLEKEYLQKTENNTKKITNKIEKKFNFLPW